MNNKYIYAVLGIALTCLSSCTSRLTRESESEYEIENAKVEQLKQSTDNYTAHNGLLNDRVYLGDRVVTIEEKEPLPAKFYREVVFSSFDPVSLGELFKFVSNYYGVRTHITEDAVAYLSSGSGGSTDSMSSSQGSNTTTAGADSISGLNQNTGGSEENVLESTRVPLTYKGSLEEFFNTLTARLNLFWDYRKARGGAHVVVYRQITETYVVKSFAGSNSTSNQLVGSIHSSTDNENTSKMQSGTAATDISLWADLEKDLRAKMSSDGRLSIQQSTGRVTVTDTPFVIEEVSTYIDDLNNQLGEQIFLQVAIYRLLRDDANDYGIDWRMVFENAKAAVNFAPDLFAGSPITADVNVIDSESHYNTSQLLLKSLSQYGKLSEVTTQRALTMNGQTVPVKSQTQRAYIESASLTTTETGVTTSLTPGAVSEGIALNLTPKIADGRSIMLQLGITLSTIDDIETQSSGDTTLQLPTVSSDSTMQRVILRSGQTLVISGLEQSQNESRYSGVGRRWTQFFGGRQETQVVRSTTIIVITPLIVEA